VATNYLGVPTATQAPSAAPGVQNFPTVVLPADGDAANAASVAQAFRVLADYVAFLVQPRAPANTQTPIVQYKNGQLQSRFVIDHMGFPVGKFIAWQEDWSDVGFVNLTATAAVNWAGRWRASISGAGGGTIGVSIPSVSPAYMDGYSRFLLLSVHPTSGTNEAGVETTEIAKNLSGQSISFATDFQARETAGFANSEIFFGVGGVSFHGAAGGYNGPGFGFHKIVGNANWFAWTRTLGGTVVQDDTGVVAASLTRRRFRCEYAGPAAGDGGVERALFYIDGALVANLTPTLGSDTLTLRAFCRLARLSTGAGQFEVMFGTTDFRANTWPGDAAL
jgi:hypothetical protein